MNGWAEIRLNLIELMDFLIKSLEFPGCWVVRHLYCQGPVSIPGPGTKIPQGTWNNQKKLTEELPWGPHHACHHCLLPPTPGPKRGQGVGVGVGKCLERAWQICLSGVALDPQGTWVCSRPDHAWASSRTWSSSCRVVGSRQWSTWFLQTWR